ncbi:type I-E CRISPR-associated protein Cse2/CasB [Actinacidiphila sp. bgisy145]|uniref:type I-E CRISPR-associated protein Cse2/CasB n=1 Tax=Actinacidiphila sp. bgisy145 TaxID=3413792 RepID=UPI003EB961C8
MTTTTPYASGTRAIGPVGTSADRCIRRLQHGYREDRPSAVSTLARLRRGAGQPANSLPDLWGQTGTEDLAQVLADAADETRTPASGTAADRDRRPVDHARAEEALHLAVTLWALHQQSHRDMDTHVAGHGLGRSVRALMSRTAPATDSGTAAATAAPELDEPVRRRFVRIGTATSLDILGQRLREIVLLLRKDDIPLDYALLAEQLYWWQLPAAQTGVRREWGRDFHLAGTVRAKAADDS